LDHRVMENGVLGSDETLPIIERLTKKYGALDVLSLDKGYNIKGFNPADEKLVKLFALPCKGFKNKERKSNESELGFLRARMWRAGVESCIGAPMCIATTRIRHQRQLEVNIDGLGKSLVR
jgi:hypothetical protein